MWLAPPSPPSSSTVSLQLLGSRPFRFAAGVVLSITMACDSSERHAILPQVSQPAQQTRLPQVIQACRDTFQLSIGLEPVSTDAGTGAQTLRSLELHVQADLREPHGVYPDGTPVSADAQITPVQAEGLLRILEQEHFFAMAMRYHSERRGKPRTPLPTGSRAGLPARSPRAHVRLSVTVHDDDWYHGFVRDVDWGKGARAALRHLRGPLQGPALQLIDQLIEQLPP